MRKKVAIVGTVGIPAKYGGFETLAEYLTLHMGHQFDFTVFCSSKTYPEKKTAYNQARLIYIPLQANGVQSILYDIVAIFLALRFVDTIIVLGVSGCVVLPIIKFISKKTIIVNIDGQEWKRAKWGKLARWFLKLSEKQAVKYADVVITDNNVIQDYVWETYKVKSELIAYGGDHSQRIKLTESILKSQPFLKQSYAFKVCRIEPENNLNMIMEAFAEFKKLNLVIVGNWNNSDYGKQLKLKFQEKSNIHLLDPVYDQSVLDQLRSNCKMYVHGHSAGGTNPSLVEAMYLGLPVLAFGVDYNRETTAHKARYFHNKEELVSLLNALTPDELQTIAKNQKNIASSQYAWKLISEQYAGLLLN